MGTVELWLQPDALLCGHLVTDREPDAFEVAFAIYKEELIGFVRAFDFAVDLLDAGQVAGKDLVGLVGGVRGASDDDVIVLGRGPFHLSRQRRPVLLGPLGAVSSTVLLVFSLLVLRQLLAGFC